MTKKLSPLLLLAIVGAFSLSGCGTTEVAKSQQVTHAAVVDLKDFLTFEKANRDQLFKIDPSIKHFADKMRHKDCPTCDQNDVRWLNSAIATVDAYKNNRSPENKANMDTALAVLQELVNQITQYFLIPAVHSLSPTTAAKYPPTKVIP